MDLPALGTLWWMLFRGRGGAASTPAAMPGPMPSTPATPAQDSAAAAANAAAASSPSAAAASADAQAAPAPIPAAAPTPTLPALPWPSTPVPATLPPFPGPGWEPDTPVSTELASRATYWNAILWDYSTKTQRKPFVQENFGGEWITFAAAWHPGDKGPKTYMATEAWRVKKAGASAPAYVSPQASAPPAAAAPATSTLFATPGVAPVVTRPAIAPVQPYPGPGAWQSNTAYVKRYQAALAGLGYYHGNVDGLAGPLTQAAVKAFQTHAGLAPVDGQAGAATAAALDQALTHATA
jgi:hypothetical protein